MAVALIGLILTGCRQDDFTNHSQAGIPDGKFMTSVSSEFSLNLSCSSAKAVAQGTYGNMSLAVYEEPWTNESSIADTRSPVTGNEVEWTDIAAISLYMTDTDGTVKVKDKAFNPCDQNIYNEYKTVTSSTTNVAAGTVKSSDFFWDTWSAMPAAANFYGYYPRPGNGNALNYKRISIISAEDARGGDNKIWNELSYAFLPQQTDDNLSHHDIMYSVSEQSVADGRYGNQGKVKGDNIQMHFIHAFSLLAIEVNRGATYTGECKISEITVSGTNVFTEGKLDIRNGTVTPSNGNGSITRAITETAIERDQPFRTTMIVQPTAIAAEGGTNAEQFVISCKIDGIVYKCPLSDINLEAGKKYAVKLTLNPNGVVVMRIWSEGRVQIGNETYSSGEHEITTIADKFTVSAQNGYQVARVLKNHELYASAANDGTDVYNLEKDENGKVYYDIIVTPSNWYSAPEMMHIHFDGWQNDKYKTDPQQAANIWSDLSGNGNDGTLKSFDLSGTVSSMSGWNAHGLEFDGTDDIVTFAGTINTTAYTMEFYICVDSLQKGLFPRLNAEGGVYPSFYIYGNNTTKSRSLQIYGHNYNTSLNCNFTTDSKTIVQLDFAYSSVKQMLEIYINGELKKTFTVTNPTISIPIASLGNRTEDNSRTLKGTYYSYILYDRDLTAAEIKHNYEVNVQRYGTQRDSAVQ